MVRLISNFGICHFSAALINIDDGEPNGMVTHLAFSIYLWLLETHEWQRFAFFCIPLALLWDVEFNDIRGHSHANTPSC